MGRITIHRGAVPERLPAEGEKPCGSVLPPSVYAGRVTVALSCVYMAGHPGPHYAAGEIWGNNSGQQQ